MARVKPRAELQISIQLFAFVQLGTQAQGVRYLCSAALQQFQQVRNRQGFVCVKMVAFVEPMVRASATVIIMELAVNI